MSQATQMDLSEAVKRAVHAVTYQAKEKEILLKTSWQSIKITGDMKRLTDGFIIFLDNAVKYSSPKSTVHITVKKTDGHAQVIIKDEGRGIAKKDQPRIFERFYRADTSRSKKDAGGYGLGLAIAKKTIDTHGGTIGVASAIGQGTTFTITLLVKRVSK